MYSWADWPVFCVWATQWFGLTGPDGHGEPESVFNVVVPPAWLFIMKLVVFIFNMFGLKKPEGTQIK